MKINPLKSRRILVVDDNRSIHEDFRKVFLTSPNLSNSTNEDEVALFGDTPNDSQSPVFEIDSAYQGQEDFRQTMVSRAVRHTSKRKERATLSQRSCSMRPFQTDWLVKKR